jgi:hypothetical protein
MWLRCVGNQWRLEPGCSTTPILSSAELNRHGSRCPPLDRLISFQKRVQGLHKKHRSAQSRTEEQRCGENFPSRPVRSVVVNLAKTSKSLAVSFAGSLALSRLHRCSHPTVPGRC